MSSSIHISRHLCEDITIISVRFPCFLSCSFVPSTREHFQTPLYMQRWVYSTGNPTVLTKKVLSRWKSFQSLSLHRNIQFRCTRWNQQEEAVEKLHGSRQGSQGRTETWCYFVVVVFLWVFFVCVGDSTFGKHHRSFPSTHVRVLVEPYLNSHAACSVRFLLRI